MLRRGARRHAPQHVIPSARHAFTLSADAQPAARARAGDSVRFEMTPEPIERLFAAGADWLAQCDLQRVNAVTGPLYVEDVVPGDILAVEILDIAPLDWGWTLRAPGLGLLPTPGVEPFLRRVTLRNGYAEVSERLRVPLRPMVGCAGVAPPFGASSTLAPVYPWGGNLDLPQLAVGATLLLPVQAPGALLWLGDLHATMGAGEAAGVAIECAGAVTVRVSVRRGLTLATPRIETAERLYVVGLDECDWQAARRHATHLMFEHLILERGLDAQDAAALFAAAVELEFGGPASAVVLASVPTSVFES